MKTVTPRQQEIADFVLAYVKQHFCSPTVREVAEHFGIYPTAAHRHLHACEQKGALVGVFSAHGDRRGWRAPE